jgi:hypothetical protein
MLRWAAGMVVAASMAAPALADPMELRMAPGLARDFARALKSNGYNCPELRAVYKVGSDDRGPIMRFYCGLPGGPRIEEPSFRVHASPSGILTINVWKQ